MQTRKSVLIALTVLGVGVIGASASAQDQRHPGMNPGGPSQGAMMQGGGMMDMGRMQERMQSMQQLMERIHESDDPAARRKLLNEHMQKMQQTMMDMRGMMMGGGMMQGGPGTKMGPGMMGGGGMMNGDKGMTMEDRQKMMEQRLDLMQQMMEQMLEQQSQTTR